MSHDPNIHRTKHFANPAHVTADQDFIPGSSSNEITPGMIIALGVFVVVIALNFLTSL